MPNVQLPPARRATLDTLLVALAASAPTEARDAARAVLVESEYDRGVVDTLLLCGALQEFGEGVAAVSPQAGWAIALLRALLALGASALSDWQSRGVSPPGAAGAARVADLLAALEARRQELAPGAPPLREVNASVGLITRLASGRPELLLVYDHDAQAWQLPGGRRDRLDATPEATLLRELHEELGLLAPPAPGAIRLEPLPTVSETRLSPTYGLLTRVAFRLYRVHLDCVEIPPQPAVRWVVPVEIAAGSTADGGLIAIGPLRTLAAQLGTEPGQLLSTWCAGG